MYEHSSTAALVDACECGRCRVSRSIRKSPNFVDPKNWWLFTVRSKDQEALQDHRQEMKDDGWDVGPIKMGDAGTVYAGKFYFKAEKPRAAVSEAELGRLAQWDRNQGEG